MKSACSCRRRIGRVSWLLPGIIMVIIPKCPICLAGYIALATGISIPIATAGWLRRALIFLCIGSLVWLCGRRLGYFRVKKTGSL